MVTTMASSKVKRSRTDYPEGIISVYDAGNKFADRYTVVYTPEETDGVLYYGYVAMSGSPFHPQGYGQHGESKIRPTATYAGQGCGKVIRFEDLPEDCQKLVIRDLAEVGS